MNIVILDAKTLGDDITLDMFDKFGNVTVYGETSPEDVKERIKNADVVILNKIKLNKSNINGAERLKLVCVTATGYDNVDTDCCREYGIAVCNVKGYSTDSVAQVTVSLALELFTHIREYTAYVGSGKYTKSGLHNYLKPVFHEISAKTWGIAGLGGIGRQTARIAAAMGCRVLAFKRSADDEFECVDIDTLCRESDIISVHLPLTDETRGIIGRRQLGLVKRGAVLINMARGAVIDERAAADAVKSGILGGFASDVYSDEPMPADHPFAGIAHMDNVLLTPHMAWGAYEARVRCMNEIAENISAFLRGEKRNRV